MDLSFFFVTVGTKTKHDRAWCSQPQPQPQPPGPDGASHHLFFLNMKKVRRGSTPHRRTWCCNTWILSVLLLVSNQQDDEKWFLRVHSWNVEVPPPPDTTRRTALVGGATAFVDSFLSGSRANAAETLQKSEYPGLVLVPGGTARYNPTIDGDWEPTNAFHTRLAASRIGATTLSPLQQPVFGDPELYYAPFLFGAWNTTATLKRKIYPYGTDYVPSTSLLEGSPRNRDEQVGHTCTYPVHCFSTLANTLANQFTVNLGTGVPESKIIQDRAFNAVSISTAYQQLVPVQGVEWDYRDAPTKLTLTFGAGSLAPDLRPLGPRRAEVFLNARATEYATATANGKTDENDENDENDPDASSAAVFCAAERSRTVMLAPGSVAVSDTETITEYTKVTDDYVVAVSRIAVYPVPNPNNREGVLWQQVGGRAVAFYDYEMDMHRMTEEFQLSDGTKVRRACVATPRDVVQCA